MIKLKHIVHGAIVSEIDMDEGAFSIGRNHDNDLQLDDGVVSGKHAILTLAASEFLPEQLDITIKDLGSTNGTYVNGQAIEKKSLRHGDLIRIGTYEYKVYDDQSHVGTQTEYIPEQ
ncbi:MAG: FHA domain-containing protein [Proteobacteria bacterium]|nr:FHA domain-containing protein [Pseudomonadota bacterium]